MKLFTFCTILALTFSSCSDWSEGQEDNFMQECEKGLKTRSGLDMSSISDDQVKAYCTCAFEKVKEAFTYDEYLNEGQQSEKAMEIYSACQREELSN